MNDSFEIRTPVWLRVFAWFAVAWAFVLIWWGAAVTTSDVGLAVPDWPFSFGKVNPEGWWSIQALKLEHGHRLVASGLGVVVTVLFAVHWFRFDCLRGRAGLAMVELFGVLALLAANVYAVQRLTFFLQERKGFVAQNMLEDAASSGEGIPFWAAAIAVTWLLVVLWMGWSWSKRGWTRLNKLGSLALILVVVQAELGGLRVVLISDIYAIIHGVLGQAFFCLLLLIAMLSGESRLILQDRSLNRVRLVAVLLVASVMTQLVFGATVRHTQRITLEATDILTTGGTWLPDWSNAGLTMIFCHKAGAILALLVAIVFALVVRRARVAGGGTLGRHASWILLVFCAQIALGVSVLYFHADMKAAFWITQLHVVNGLAILALATAAAVRSWRAAGSVATV